MKILLYYPANKRSVPMETMLKQHIEQGHEVLMLTICEYGDFHRKLEELGVSTFVYTVNTKNKVLYYVKHIVYLIRFCHKHKVKKVYSHLQIANILAVVAQFFIPASLTVFRHHDYSKNTKERITDVIINRLAKRIIVPSSGVRNLMLTNEKVQPDKVGIIPYIYNFTDYALLEEGGALAVRQRYSANLLLIMVSRLVEEKRHLLVFSVIHRLVKEGKDVKLLVMDEGAEKERLERYIYESNLDKHIFLLGFQTNIMDYIQAADVMVHPSLAEASCSAVKEAGLKKKIVIACHDVGDFDDYLIHRVNGFLMTKESSEEQLYEILTDLLNNKDLYQEMGEKLRDTILRKFSPSQAVIDLYEDLLKV